MVKTREESSRSIMPSLHGVLSLPRSDRDPMPALAPDSDLRRRSLLDRVLACMDITRNAKLMGALHSVSPAVRHASCAAEQQHFERRRVDSVESTSRGVAGKPQSLLADAFGPVGSSMIGQASSKDAAFFAAVPLPVAPRMLVRYAPNSAEGAETTRDEPEVTTVWETHNTLTVTTSVHNIYSMQKLKNWLLIEAVADVAHLTGCTPANLKAVDMPMDYSKGILGKAIVAKIAGWAPELVTFSTNLPITTIERFDFRSLRALELIAPNSTIRGTAGAANIAANDLINLLRTSQLRFTVDELVLEGWRFKEDVLTKELFSALQRLKRLVSLTFRKVEFSATGTSNYDAFLSDVVPRLTTLVLDATPMTGVTQLMSGGEQLKVLRIVGTPAVDVQEMLGVPMEFGSSRHAAGFPPEKFTEAARTPVHSNIESLSISTKGSWSLPQPPFVEALPFRFPNVASLDFAGALSDAIGTLKVFSSILASPALPNLRHLNVANSVLEVDGVRKLLDSLADRTVNFRMPPLQKLCLSEIATNWEQVLATDDPANAPLRMIRPAVLDLSLCRLRTPGMRHLAAQIAAIPSSSDSTPGEPPRSEWRLQELHVDGSCLLIEEWGDDLMAAMMAMSSLKFISMRNLWGDKPERLAAIEAFAGKLREIKVARVALRQPWLRVRMFSTIYAKDTGHGFPKLLQLSEDLRDINPEVLTEPVDTEATE